MFQHGKPAFVPAVPHGVIPAEPSGDTRGDDGKHSDTEDDGAATCPGGGLTAVLAAKGKFQSRPAAHSRRRAWWRRSTDGGIIPASSRTIDCVDLRREEGKQGAPTIRKHVGKTDAELLAGMGPTGNRWWPHIQFIVYRNGSYFRLKTPIPMSTIRCGYMHQSLDWLRRVSSGWSGYF